MKWILFAAVAVLGGVAAWWALQGAGPSSGPGVEGTSPPGAGAAEPANGETAPAAPVAAPASVPAEEPALTPERRRASPASGPVLTVVEFATAAPLPGVPVEFWTTGSAKTRLVTDERGCVELPAFDGTAWLVAGEGSARTTSRVESDSGPWRLRLSSVGRVVCTVREPNGELAEDGTTVVLRPRVEAQKARRRPDDFDDSESQLAVVAGGRATFDEVPLGRALEVSAAPSDESRATTGVSFSGPRAPGEEVTVELTLGGSRAVVTGRLVDGLLRTGLPGMKVVAELIPPRFDRARWRPTPSACEASATTDESGEFRCEFDVPTDGSHGWKIRLRQPARPDMPGAAGFEIAVVDLPSALSAEGVGLGDVPVRGLDLVLAGVVVDRSGAPIAGAEVRLVRHVYGSLHPVPSVASARTDDQGRFRIFGKEDQRRVWIQVIHSGWVIDDAGTFERGTDDARVEIGPAGAVAGSVRMPPGDVPLIVRVLDDLGDDGRPRRFADAKGHEQPVPRRGEFEVGALRPGKARVSFRLGFGEHNTVLVVDEVEVTSGQVTRDPRLQAVDLSQRIGSLRVTVLGPDGEPAINADVGFRRERTEVPSATALASWESVRTTPEGMAVILFPRDPAASASLQVRVRQPGFRTVRLDSVRADTTVRLIRSSPAKIRVRLAGLSSHAAEAVEISAFADDLDPEVPENERGSEAGWLRARFDDPAATFGIDRVAVVTVKDVGRYRVGLVLWKETQKSNVTEFSTTRVDAVPEPAIVTVGESGEPVEVVVWVTPYALAEAMKRLR